MEWLIRDFSELNSIELYKILNARAEVFIIEQNCVCLDPDGLDPVCKHICASDAGVIAAYCRVTPPGTRFAETGIGRVITTKKYRGSGLGRELMTRAVQYIYEELGSSAIRISAQAYLKKFYESFGFEAVSDVTYLEDDIPHYDMLNKRPNGRQV